MEPGVGGVVRRVECLRRSSKQRCAAPVEGKVVAVATVVESGGGLEEEEGNGGGLEEEEEEYGVRRLLRCL